MADSLFKLISTTRWSRLGWVIGLGWLISLSLACAAQPEPSPQAANQQASTATDTPNPTPSLTPSPTPSATPSPNPTATTPSVTESDLTAALLGDGPALNRVVQALDGDVTRLEDSLKRTRSIPQTQSEQWTLWSNQSDLDGDGQAELLLASPAFRLSDEGLTESCYVAGCLGYVSIFENTAQGFSLTHGLQNAFVPDDQLDYPQLEKLADLNQDGLTELVIKEAWCGANTCGFNLQIGRWDGRAWQNLGTVSESYADLEWLDVDGDGILEIRTFGGTVGSAGAGLQRTRTTLYGWDNGVYTVTQITPTPSEHPYYRLLDAHAALQNEDPETALQLLNSLLAEASDPENPAMLMDARSENRIRSFALILLMLTQALEQDEAGMQNSLAQLQADYLQPDNPYPTAAEALWQTWQNTQDARAACQAMAAVVQSRPLETEAEFFEWYGYATERLDFQQVCPLE